jgi:arginyl-tRNA synthetase
LSINPFGEFREECERILMKPLSRLAGRVEVKRSLEVPPSPAYGELASSICFELAKALKTTPMELAKRISSTIEATDFKIGEKVEAVGGYINFHLNRSKFAKLTIESARKLDENYGYVKTDHPLRIIIEHTSANPIHPLHIGTARNPILGDALARILAARGHKISRHFYIDDMGRQIAIIAYGYQKLGSPDIDPHVKPDHFIGWIYAITSCLTEIRSLKEQIKQYEGRQGQEEIVKKLKFELDDWVAAAAELQEKYPAMFSKLLDEINRDPNPEASINRLIQEYEAGKASTKELFRKVSNLCLEGFKQTLNRVGILFDQWDWESDLVWSGKVNEIVQQLKRTPFVFETKGVLELDAEKAVNELGLRPVLNIMEGYSVPSLTLTRADGTTLYTTRDIAYSLQKFEKTDRVINVIGAEQSLAQLQLKIALCVLGYVKAAQNQIHFSFGLVELPGYKMSGRRGRYITFDDVISEAVKRAYNEVAKRSPHLPEEDRRKIADMVGIGAIKYSLISVEPIKSVVFNWERVLDFEQNSAPFIQYAHARACNILKKAGEETYADEIDLSTLIHPLEWSLILKIGRFPEVFIEAAENLKPNAIAEYANDLANCFNSFYAAVPVIQAETPTLRAARLALVDAIRITLRNALQLLGIEAPARM